MPLPSIARFGVVSVAVVSTAVSCARAPVANVLAAISAPTPAAPAP